MFFAISGVGLVAPLLLPIQTEFGVSSAAIGLIASTFGGARLLADLPAGRLAERIAGRWLILAGLAPMAVGALVAAAAPTFWVLLAGRLAMGLGAGLLTTICYFWALHLAPPESRARMLAVLDAIVLAGLMLFPLGSGVLADAAGWRPVFLVAAGLMTLGVPLAFSLGWRTDPRSAGAGAPAEAAIALTSSQRRALVGVYVAQFFFFLHGFAFAHTLFPLFGARTLGLSSAAVGVAMGLVAVVNLVASLVGGVLADRHGRKLVVVTSLAALALSQVSLLLADGSGLFLGIAVVVGLTRFGNATLPALLGDVVPRRAVGRALGSFRFAADLAAFVGPFVVGALIDAFGFAVPIWLLALAAAGGAVTAHRLIRTSPQTTDGAGEVSPGRSRPKVAD